MITLFVKIIFVLILEILKYKQNKKNSLTVTSTSSPRLHLVINNKFIHLELIIL
jgi:hypothetical protein